MYNHFKEAPLMVAMNEFKKWFGEHVLPLIPDDVSISFFEYETYIAKDFGGTGRDNPNPTACLKTEYNEASISAFELFGSFGVQESHWIMYATDEELEAYVSRIIHKIDHRPLYDVLNDPDRKEWVVTRTSTEADEEYELYDSMDFDTLRNVANGISVIVNFDKRTVEIYDAWRE
jgi:hypothetical protein